MLPESYYDDYIPKLEIRLKDLIARQQETYPDLDAVFTVLRGHSVSGQICDYVATVKAELTVLGTRGRTGLKKLLLGTTAEKVIHRCPSSVLAIKPADFED
jgi:nucleotide-binding universal stress UspA family protein